MVIISINSLLKLSLRSLVAAVHIESHLVRPRSYSFNIYVERRYAQATASERMVQ